MVLATIIHNCAKYITNIIFKFTVAGATPKAERIRFSSFKVEL